MKHFVCILFFCACTWACVCTFGFAQNIESIYYTYDNAGNRIGRIIVVPESQNRSPRNNAPANDGDENSGEDDNIPYDALADSDTPAPIPQQDYDAKIYPNPTADVLHVKVSESSILRYVLHNSTGTELLSGVFTSATTLQISAYARGVYYLIIYKAAKPSSERRVWKVVKQ
ncbi:MAG: T9SS type A sorting domain-containing protein [Bacteroidales bacterium]|nr:T9SS type A sorting domain-containing protein [Bacteroidales bacterium]